MKIDRPGPILCFGEVLMRLGAPPGTKLVNAHSFAAHVGGTEANVGSLLAQLGRRVEMLTILPRSPLGDQCEAELRRVGMSTVNIARADGRLGLYFLGGGSTGGRIVYDREGSAFARNTDAFDWPTLAQSAGWFHMSGINLALGSKCAEFALEALEAMAAAGVPVSFDVNHRASLWEDRSADDLDRVKKAMGLADVLFAGPRDIDRALGDEASAFSMSNDKPAFIASTIRSAGKLSARIQTPDRTYETEAAPLGQVIDRIGSGDAFAGAVIDAVLREASLEDCARAGLAAAVSKHAIAGDRWIGTREEIENFDPFSPGEVRR